MPHDLKGRSKIVAGDRGTEADVVNGAVRVLFVSRTLPAREGYGSAQIQGGVASRGEAQVVSGALRVRII